MNDQSFENVEGKGPVRLNKFQMFAVVFGFLLVASLIGGLLTC